MLPKPDACKNCVFYNYGKYFVPDKIVPGSTVYFLAERPAENEEAGKRLRSRAYGVEDWEDVVPQPLIGATGLQFDQRFLPLSGLKREEVSLGNAIRCRPGPSLGIKGGGLPPITTAMKLETSQAPIVQALKHCRDAHMRLPPSVKTIVTMGRYAMFQLTGIQNEDTEFKQKQGVMESWRGYGVSKDNFQEWSTLDTTRYDPLTKPYRILFTLHIAALFQRMNERFFNATLQDFSKLGWLLRGKWPEALPPYRTMPPKEWPDYACFDTEYTVPQGELIRWSLTDSTYQNYVVSAAQSQDHSPLLRKPMKVLLQNAFADLPYLQLVFGDLSLIDLEDMMLAHSVLWTGERMGMNFIASKYGTVNRWKHLIEAQPEMYSMLDSYQPMKMWQEYFVPAFKDDLVSWKVYRNYRMKLIPIYDIAHQTGQALDQSRIAEIQSALQVRLARYQARARELTDDPRFNLGGRKKLMEIIYR